MTSRAQSINHQCCQCSSKPFCKQTFSAKRSAALRNLLPWLICVAPSAMSIHGAHFCSSEGFIRAAWFVHMHLLQNMTRRRWKICSTGGKTRQILRSLPPRQSMQEISMKCHRSKEGQGFYCTCLYCPLL